MTKDQGLMTNDYLLKHRFQYFVVVYPVVQSYAIGIGDGLITFVFYDDPPFKICIYQLLGNSLEINIPFPIGAHSAILKHIFVVHTVD